jgi:TetR/AcrR family transcriptional regulator, transcriptional repressor for nem operon
MARHSQQEKAINHERIVGIAAARIREAGTTAPSVAEIMQAAGLTHGGFYKHFASRDDLVAEAVERTFADSEKATAAVIDGAEDPLAAFVDWYVSAEHRDDPASGCGVVALGGEVARSHSRVRSAYTQQVRRYLTHLEQLLGGANVGGDAPEQGVPDGREGKPGSDPEVRRRAILTLSALVGAVLVARAVDDLELSDEIICEARAACGQARAVSTCASSGSSRAPSTS